MPYARFLSRALIPLHKPSGSCIQQYHQQLSYCITQYLEKDPKLADIILRGLVKYWPHTNSSKEVSVSALPVRGLLDFVALAATLRPTVCLNPARAQHVLVLVGHLCASRDLQPSAYPSPPHL